MVQGESSKANATALLADGIARQKVGDLSGASEVYRAVLAANPKDADALHLLGIACRALGRLPEAEEVLRRALALRPAHPHTLNDLAGLCASGGAFAEAIELLQVAVRIDPALVKARNNLGCALLQLQRCEEAVAILREAAAIAPHYEPVLRNLAAGLWALKRDDEARAVAASQPTAVAAGIMAMLADLSCSTGEFDEAIALANEAVDIDPSNADLHLALGTALLGAGRSDDAASAIREAAERGRSTVPEAIRAPRAGTPASPPIMTTSFVESIAEQTFRAMEAGWADIFRALVAKNPRDEKLYLRFAHFKAVQGDHAAMLEIYGELLKVAPEHPVASHMVAALSGSATTRRAPDAYVTHTFDGFADSFDENLKDLGYCGPDLALGVIRRTAAAGSMLDILDIGCGTGLCGLVLRPFARRLVGVDLSSGMLEKASARGIYDDLARAEITAYLRQLDGAYDMIVATDVLVYFGAIDEVVGGAAKALRKGGHFIATMEHLIAQTEERQQFRLQQHGRYSHGEDYVRSVIAAAGFALETLENANIRSERGVPVAGLVIAARKA